MKHFEVERRVNVYLENKLPKEAILEKVYGGRDYYFSINPYERVRDMHLTFDRKMNLICPKSIQKHGFKRIIDDGEVEEEEEPVNALETLKILNKKLGKPIVTVEGCRREYLIGELTLCSDYITSLGFWTEIEKTTNSKEENKKSLKLVEDAFESLGIKKERLEKGLYPDLLLKKQNDY